MADLQRTHAQGRLAEIDKRIDACREAVDALRSIKSDPQRVADFASADKWQKWRDERLREHQAAAARLAALREDRRAAAARASARFEVLKALCGT